MARVLFFGEERDLNDDALFLCLLERGHDVTRLAYSGVPEVGVDLVSGILSCVHGDVDLNDAELRCWVRNLPQPAVVSSQPADAFASQERSAFYEGIMNLPRQGAWLNAPQHIRRANNKIVQLDMWRAVGGGPPNTLVGTKLVDDSDMRVYKSLTGSIYANERTTCWTWPTAGERPPSSRPALQQTRIERHFETRVIVLGDTMWAVAFSPRTTIEPLDWRFAENDAFDVSECIIPQKTRNAISQYMAALGLQLAAFDFAVDASGEWFFLEANVMGNWLWYETLASMPITAAICSALTSSGEEP